MSAIEEFNNILKSNLEGESRGIYSLCSAHSEVIKAAMKQSMSDGSLLLIESTSNQVDQFGGYTGMKPADFISYVKKIAGETGYPDERILFGGDHLGPNAWQSLKAADAMKNARELIAGYVKAGYQKIHLDASMYCADDEGDRHKPLADEIVAERAADLCSVAEKTIVEMGNPHRLSYIIGTEVPVPGGSREKEEQVNPTSSEDAIRTYEVTRAAFEKKGLSSAWKRVCGLVVQPGVEFGDDQVFHYNRNMASGLSSLAGNRLPIIFEAHSTDYQTGEGLKHLVEDHFCILKVGPWVTFAYREAVFALELIERELCGKSGCQLSALRDTIENVMIGNPKYWKSYYSGTEEEIEQKRKYSFSDRVRYYWPDSAIKDSISRLMNNLSGRQIPLSLLSQFMPSQFYSVQDGWIQPVAEELIHDRIADVIRIYSAACGTL